ncbi:conserved hypothetical protein [Theileria orientalis strain Shintoku]|uniref:Uncharacterized protein n=1 Tax=Theileria orientalis strain Shintoku TaxID=869250 RepID=J4CCV7_THEOR|nr:conserved hypothetical protein [Theileria orientalis strain Shintoku]BAM40062.1 conserved hypothetical protein [Theileria orientalis strain Shintoku]|eukprot:XP_009690363.1 conserved hypothetical protein [Theileria orientalis strain Shintoku]
MEHDESIVKENDKIITKSEMNFDNTMERINTGNELFQVEDYHNSSDALSLGNKPSVSNNFDNTTYEGEGSNNKDSPLKRNKNKLIIFITTIVLLVILTVVLIVVFAPSSGTPETIKDDGKTDAHDTFLAIGPEFNVAEITKRIAKEIEDEGLTGTQKDPKTPKESGGDGTTKPSGDTTKDPKTLPTGDTKKPEPKDSKTPKDTGDKKPELTGGEKLPTGDPKTPGEKTPKVGPTDTKTPPGITDPSPTDKPIDDKSAPQGGAGVDTTKDPEIKKDEKKEEAVSTLVRKHKYVLKKDPAEYDLKLDKALNPENPDNSNDKNPKNQIKPEDIYDTKRDVFIYTKTYGNNFVQTKPFEFNYVQMTFGGKNLSVSKVSPSPNCAFYHGASKTDQIIKVVYYDGSVLVEKADKLEYLTIWEENFDKMRLVTIVATPNAAGGINKENRERAYIQYKILGEVTALKDPVITQDYMNTTIQVLNSIFK